MVTLHLSSDRVSERVLENRQRNRISFGKFRKGLLRAYEYDLAAMAGFPKNYWHDQYDLWIAGERGPIIHDSTIKAMEWVENNYKGECVHASSDSV
jgi:hypothetical protein